MKRTRYALPMIIGLLILGGALFYSIRTNPNWQNFDLDRFTASLSGLAWHWIAWSVSAIYVTYFLRAVRWKVLIRPMKPDASVKRLLSATIIGFAAIGILGRAGELARPYLIARKENLPISSQLAVWLLERWFDSLILFAFVGFAVGQLDFSSIDANPETVQWIQGAGYVVAVGTICLLVVLLLLRGYYDATTDWVVARLYFLSEARRGAVAHFVKVFGQGLHSIRDNLSVLVCLLLTVTAWLCIAAAYYGVLAAAESRLTFFETIIFMSIVMAGTIVQIPGVGGGMQITTVLALTEIFGVGVEVASGLALLLWMLTFLIVVPPALVLLAWNGLSLRKLRQLESEI